MAVGHLPFLERFMPNSHPCDPADEGLISDASLIALLVAPLHSAGRKSRKFANQRRNRAFIGAVDRRFNDVLAPCIDHGINWISVTDLCLRA